MSKGHNAEAAAKSQLLIWPARCPKMQRKNSLLQRISLRGTQRSGRVPPRPAVAYAELRRPLLPLSTRLHRGCIDGTYRRSKTNGNNQRNQLA